MINFNQVRNGQQFTVEEIAAAKAQCKLNNTNNKTCPSKDVKLANNTNNNNNNNNNLKTMTNSNSSANNQQEIAMTSNQIDNAEYLEYLAEQEAQNAQEVSIEEKLAMESTTSVVSDRNAANAGTKTTITKLNEVSMTINKTNSTKTNSNKEIKSMKFDIDNGTINDRLVRNYAIIRDLDNKSESLVNRTQLINLVIKSIAGKSPKAAHGLVMKSLEQALFFADARYGNPQVDGLTRQEAAELGKAYVIEVGFGKIAAGVLGKETFNVVAQSTELPIATDKQASNCVYVGARALGVYRDGDVMTSVNPVNDVTKGGNRIAAANFPQAEADGQSFSALGRETEYGTVRSFGLSKKSIFVPGLAIFAQGMIHVNEGVSFDFYADKSWTIPVSVDTLGNEITVVAPPAVVSNGSTITVNDVVVYEHNNFTDLEIHSVVPVLNEEKTAWLIKIEATMICLGRINIKLRGNGCKGMTHQSGAVVVERNDWELMFTSESVKTSEFILEMFANANPGHVVGLDGKVRNVAGGVVSSRQINKWYAQAGQYFTVQLPIHESNVPSLKKAITNKKVTFSAPNAEGIVTAEQHVFGICSDVHVGIELSSADENAGFSNLDATSVAIQSLVSPRLAAKFAKTSVKQSKKVASLSHNGNFKNFMAVDHAFDGQVKYQAIAKRVISLIAEKGSVKAALSHIVNEGVKSFNINFQANNAKWVCVFPIHAFLAYGSFDAAGNPALSMSETNPIALAVEFLVAAQTATPAELRTVLNEGGANHVISNWVLSVMAKATAKVLRAGESFHAKAIADWRIPCFSAYGRGFLPSVMVAAESPILNRGSKSMTVNEVVTLWRTPMPATVVAAVKVANFALDANVMAVNPLVMDVNHGDNDGDMLYISAPRLAGASISVAEAMTFNNTVVSIGGYRDSLSASKSLSTTLNEISKVANFSEKTRLKFVAKFFQIDNTVSMNVWGETLERVQRVYRVHVGKSYDIAFCALQQFAAMNADGRLSEAQSLAGLKEVMTAWTRYEDEALCGYSENSFAEMEAYIAGEEQTRFISAVAEGLKVAKKDFKNGASFAGNYATIAFAIRVASKGFKSAQAKETLNRQAYLAVAAAKISDSQVVIKALASAVNASPVQK